MIETIGYVTLEDANKYVAEHFLSSNTTRVAWESLSDADKMVLLRNSFGAIERLPFRGRKTSATQPSAFPRWPSTEIPVQIMHAQIVNAVTLADESSREDVAYYDKLRTFGVESYTVGNLSETLVAPSENSGAASNQGIYSQEAMGLMVPWLRGGFDIV